MKVAKKITLPVKIVNGKFASNLNMIRSILDAYNGHTIDITFAKRFNKRSNNQNAYYWGVIIPIMQNALKEEWGEIWDKDRLHEFLLANCNFDEIVNEQTGEVIKKVRRTTENTTIQQEEYHEKIRRLAKDFFNTEIPLPNEDLKLEF